MAPKTNARRTIRGVLMGLTLSSISAVPGSTSAQILPERARAWQIHLALATGSGHRLYGGNTSTMKPGRPAALAQRRANDGVALRGAGRERG